MFSRPTKASRTHKVAPLALGICSALLVVSCGTSTIDTQKAERVLKQKVIAQTGVAIASVTCPDTVAVKKGATFSCVAHGADGTHAPISVQQTDDQGNVNYTADLVSQSLVQSKITASLANQQIPLSSIHCPAVLEYAIGRQYVCELTSMSGQTAHATVTLEANGHFSFTIGH